MDFELSEEQVLLKDSVDRFVQDNYSPDDRLKLSQTELGFSRDHWKTMAELGWLGMAFPEEVGGFGGGAVETMIMMESMGRGLVLEPFVSTVLLGGALIAEAGSEEQIESIIPSVIEGQTMLAFAYAEPQSRFNLNDVETTASKSGDGYVLNGTKSVVYHGGTADKIVISARTSGESRDADGISLFVVDREAAGMDVRAYRTVDGQRAADIRLENVSVGADALLGAEGAAAPVIEKITDRAIGALCAEAVGAMAAANDITNEYLKTRKQFGIPIGKFQVLQHRMVDMYMEAEQSKSMSDMAAMKLDLGYENDTKRAVSAAKSQIGKACKFVGQQSVQLHGGMGMTDEYSIGHYFKRLSTIEMLFGNTDYHLNRFSALS
ncbi:pimeloyl-CoA dehydrogenase small subunit [Sneathiella sp. P13V-1]|uniref:acyl-CoA dehydrogenase family protein n=1 Tax=Sneathiella sp. P13V-1 TaxID=2697366 RepID=UPI00187B2854|nr:acyl-CoA dehydrogenase family protein [Sneathiella sp. P13V-1]MBE7635355.1 pimeloyl-CoA dehydrogenase small subunit [Sneathiella sp. P13V-1]